MGEQAQISELRKQIENSLDKLRDGQFASNAVENGIEQQIKRISERRELRGHFQKILSVQWAGRGSDLLISASQDGKLIVWNADTTNKLNAISLNDPFVMTCAYEQGNNQLVAVGGLENVCYIYTQGEYEHAIAKPTCELAGHEGFISVCRFLSNRQIVTSSGDGTCRLWDIKTEKTTHYFKGHVAGVMSISPCPTNKAIFVTGSLDYQCMLWDVRQKGAVASYKPKNRRGPNPYLWEDDEPEDRGEEIGCKIGYNGHESDVNSVSFFPDGFAFGTGSDDTTCRLWDTRCHQQINSFRNTTVVNAVNSVQFSKSGRILFGGYDDCNLLGWDTLQNASDMEEATPVFGMRKHSKKITEVAVHSEGKAIATCSWDTLIKIYA